MSFRFSVIAIDIYIPSYVHLAAFVKVFVLRLTVRPFCTHVVNINGIMLTNLRRYEVSTRSIPQMVAVFRKKRG